MATLSPTLALVLLAVAALLLPVAVGLAIARGVRRRLRGAERHRTRRLARLIRGHLRGRVPALALADRVRASSESELWTALEAWQPRLARSERRRLGRLLERGRHAHAERRALLQESPLRRELAAKRLGLLAGPLSRRALRSALGASPELVAFAAARSLARDGDAKALVWLLEQPGVLPHRNAREWVTLIRAFGRGALPRLTAAMETGIADPRALRAAVESLGSARYAAAAPGIERQLRHDSVDVRVAAARALGRIQAGPCSDALLFALRDTAWPVRAQAAWALGRLGLDAAVPSLAGCLTDREWWVRRHAAYALAVLGERGRAALRDALTTSPDRYARDMAEEALERGATA